MIRTEDTVTNQILKKPIIIVECSNVLGPKLIFVTGLVKFVTAVARSVYPDLLG